MARVRAANARPALAVRRIVSWRGTDSVSIGAICRPPLTWSCRSTPPFISVLGCFRHLHSCPRGCRQPASNLTHSRPKLARNVERDTLARAALQQLGWRAVTTWECDVPALGLPDRIHHFLRAGEHDDQSVAPSRIRLPSPTQ